MGQKHRVSRNFRAKNTKKIVFYRFYWFQSHTNSGKNRVLLKKYEKKSRLFVYQLALTWIRATYRFCTKYRNFYKRGGGLQKNFWGFRHFFEKCVRFLRFFDQILHFIQFLQICSTNIRIAISKEPNKSQQFIHFYRPFPIEKPKKSNFTDTYQVFVSPQNLTKRTHFRTPKSDSNFNQL